VKIRSRQRLAAGRSRLAADEKADILTELLP
jgi:hypothetical protein